MQLFIKTENSKGNFCKDPRCAFPCESEVIFVMFCAFPVLFWRLFILLSASLILLPVFSVWCLSPVSPCQSCPVPGLQSEVRPMPGRDSLSLVRLMPGADSLSAVRTTPTPRLQSVIQLSLNPLAVCLTPTLALTPRVWLPLLAPSTATREVWPLLPGPRCNPWRGSGSKLLFILVLVTPPDLSPPTLSWS